MNKTLVIVESPAKARTIKQYLGQDYEVMSSVGHVRDLPKSNKEAVDIENGYIPKYIVSPGKEKVIKEMATVAQKSDGVLLASDPDREGEAIAWHVAELIKDKNKNIKRIVFHEITKEAVNEAINNPRAIDTNLKEAQEARRVLDRLVGYDLSGLIWKKVRYGLSAGRVQSPALRIVMEREREIRAFIPEDYFIMTANLKKGSLVVPFTCSTEPRDRNEVERIKQLAETSEWHVRDIKENEAQRSARAPFTTSTLQQSASSRLGFSPSRTMATAQKLYEAGHITYMRTDSTTLSKSAQQQILTLIKSKYGNQYAKSQTYKTKSKSAQEAHEAIRPTKVNNTTAGNTADQKALYNLIWSRSIASQMAPARVLRTKVIANITSKDNKIPDFTVNGSRVVFDGWLVADPKARGEDIEVPKLAKGDKLILKSFAVEEKQTQPPNRYSEAGLIKELEKRGIGRPSTYASIMKTIINRGYVTKVGKTLIPTDTGDVVSSFLEEHFTDYISDDFTSDMESKLDDIAVGKREYVKTLDQFYKPFTKAVSLKENIEKLTNLGPAPKEWKCPLCKSEMVIKLGRHGKFLSCIKYPDCMGARLIDGSEIKEAETIGKDPETGENIYILTGRYGPYVQLGETPEKGKRNAKKPKRSPLPPDVDPENVSIKEALRFLSLPRELGLHEDTGEPITAGLGRFGPYIVHAGDYRSLKGTDNPYDITLDRAKELLREPKPGRKGETLAKTLGVDPKTKKLVNVYQSKSGLYLRKGFRRISLPEKVNLETFSLEDAQELMKP